MNRVYRIAVVGLGLLLLGAVAGCNNEEPQTDPVPTQPIAANPTPLSNAPNGSATTVDRMEVYAGQYYQFSGNQSGIWVTGQARISVPPDVAIVNLGVETQAATVSEARDQAARVMDAVFVAVRERGVEDRNVQTRSYNIYPRYEWGDVVENGVRTSKQRVVGYQVTNTVTVKLVDLDRVGEIIDAVANAGGDATRINGIAFTVENTAGMLETLREQAVTNAMEAAEQFATLTGVEMGTLVFITETGTNVPVGADSGRAEEGAAPAPTTPIATGELEMSMSVQAAFTIE